MKFWKLFSDLNIETLIVLAIVAAFCAFGVSDPALAGVALIGMARYTGPGGMPTVEDLKMYEVNRPNAAEVIRQPLYDHILYPTAGILQMSFFQLPIGQGVATSPGTAVGAVKTFGDTNMTLGGQLPARQAFLAESIEVDVYPGDDATANTYSLPLFWDFLAVAADAYVPGMIMNDAGFLYWSGRLRLFIGNKDYMVDGPLVKFPPKAHLEVQGALANNSATTGLVGFGAPFASGRPYYLEPPVSLQANQNFAVFLEWPGLVATVSGFNARIGVRLDGYMFRSVQ